MTASMRSVEVAARLGVSPARVRCLVHEGRLHSVRIPGQKAKQFDPAEVEALVESRGQAVPRAVRVGPSQRTVAEQLGLTRSAVQSALRSGLLEDLNPESVERYRQHRALAQAARDSRKASEQTRRQHSRSPEPRRPRTPRFSEVHAAQLAELGYVPGTKRGNHKILARLPIEPLLRLHPGRSILSMTRSLGTEWANVHKALREGVTWAQADRWAVACGFHPCQVWGQAWWDLCYAESED